MPLESQAGLLINLSSANTLHASVELEVCTVEFCSKQAQQKAGSIAFFEPSFQSCRVVASHPSSSQGCR